MRGYKPWKILLNRGLRDALRLDAGDSGDYIRHDAGDSFLGLPIRINETVSEPIIMIDPLDSVWKLEKAESTSDEVLWNQRKRGIRNPNEVNQPKWKSRHRRTGFVEGRTVPKRSGL